MRVSTLIAAALMSASSVQPYSVTISSETKGIGALYVDGQKVTDLYNTGNVDSVLSMGGGRHIVSYLFSDNDGDGAAAFASRAVSGATILGATGTTSVKYLSGDAPATFTDFGFDDSAWSSSGLATCAFNPSSASKFVWPTSCTTGSGPQKVNVRYAFDLNPLIVTYDASPLGTTGSGPVPITIRLESKPACNVQVEIQNPTATTSLSACTLTFTPDNWNVGQTVQLSIKNWATPNTGSVDLPLTFKTSASSSSSACYADMPLHCFQQPLTLTKRYDTGTVGSCTSWGDPHFRDFDGTTFDFMGSSGDHFYYIDTPELTFQARHILWGSAAAGMTASNAYAVRYLNYLAVSTLESRGVWSIYGNPPSNILSASGTTLTVAGGVSNGGAVIPVTFSGSYLSVSPMSISPKFAGRTRGLCGNFNRVPNEQATSTNNWNGDAYVVNGRILRDIGTTTTRFLASSNAGPLLVQPSNRYITSTYLTDYPKGISSVPEVAAFNQLNSQGSCPAVIGSTCPTGPSKPQPPVNTPNSPPPPSCVGDCGEVINNPPPPPAQTTVVEYYTSTTTDSNGAPTVIVGSNVVILSTAPQNLNGGSPNNTDLSAALIAAGVIGAVAVIGMGAFLLRRRRQMIQETADTMYSVQSVIANSQGNVGNQFLENPIYENDIQQASGDNLRMDSDQYSTISSVHQLATQMSGVTALGNSGTGSINRPPSVAGSVRAGSIRSAQFTRD